LDAKAEKAEGGFAENVARNAEGGGDDEVAEGVGQKVTKKNSPRSLTDDIGGENERAFSKGEDKSTNDAGGPCPTESGENDDDEEECSVGGEPGGEGGAESEKKVEAGNGHEEFCEAHGQSIGPTSEVACEATDGQTEETGESDADETDTERDARTVEEAGEDIATGGITTEKINGGG
jgi:hypothetical protein